jgi:hypothetical protein
VPTSTDVPGRLPVAIDGHPYLADANGFVRETVQVIRQQADVSFEPGESSLNPQGLWRRSQESWVHGAGQVYLDGRKGLSAYSQISQDPERFRSSKGLDCWTQGQISLLHPAMRVWSTANTNLALAIAQGTGLTGDPVMILYAADGNELYWAGIPYSGLNTLALQNGTGWTATNATIAALSQWFRLTATSAAAVTVTSPTGTSGVPVDPGRRYGVEFWSQYVSGGAGRVHRVVVNWYTAAGALISSTTLAPAPGVDSGAPPVLATDTPTAPANAAFASVTLSWATNWSNGEIHEVRSITLGPYDDVSTIGYPDAWTAAVIQAGQAAQPIQSIATDGYNVWAALGTSGLHRTLPGGFSSTADVPGAPGVGQISLVGYANGFLLAAGGSSATGQNTLWQVTSPLSGPALSAAIKTHPNPNFIWTGISPGRSCVYAFGNSGGNGEVYKILFDPNTGTLSSAASMATYLPDGETIHALQFYAGGIVMGTGKGFRLGVADGTGNIDYGPLIPTTWPVRCLEPQDRYCWFGYTNPDASSTGLGRVDLGFLTDNLVPAWAADLMTPETTAQGDVQSVVTFAPYGYTASQRPPVRVFAVSGRGVYIEDPGSRVPTANFQTGTIRYSTSEPKTTRSLDLRHHALPAGATVSAEMQRDTSGTWEAIGSSSTTGAYGPAAPLDLLSETAEAMEFRFTLTRPSPSGTDYSKSPEMTRWTSKVLPVPSTIDETFTIPIEMRTEVLTNTGDGVPYGITVPTEIAYLKALEQSRTLITLQVGADTYTNCFVLASQFKADQWGPGRKWLEGTYTIQISTARG